MEIRSKMETQELIMTDELDKHILAKKTEKNKHGSLGRTIMGYHGRKQCLQEWSEQIGQLLKHIDGEVP